MASELNPQKRFMLRISLVTGSTLATIIGAQSLISLESTQDLSEVFTPPAEEALENPVQVIPTQPNIAAELPAVQSTESNVTTEDAQTGMTPTIVRAAPSITVLRHPGTQTLTQSNVAASANNQVSVIQPPAPVELAAPAPIVVQGPAPVVVQQSPGSACPRRSCDEVLAVMRQYYTTFPAMGSHFQIWLETELDGAALLQEVPAWVESAEACLSRFRNNSELSFVNKRSRLKTSISEM